MHSVVLAGCLSVGRAVVVYVCVLVRMRHKLQFVPLAVSVITVRKYLNAIKRMSKSLTGAFHRLQALKMHFILKNSLARILLSFLSVFLSRFRIG